MNIRTLLIGTTLVAVVLGNQLCPKMTTAFSRRRTRAIRFNKTARRARCKRNNGYEPFDITLRLVAHPATELWGNELALFHDRIFNRSIADWANGHLAHRSECEIEKIATRLSNFILRTGL
jgi:hypothetical protein